MPRVIPITEFLNRDVDVGVKTINNPYSVVVYRLNEHVDNDTEIEVKQVVRGRKIFIKITADYSVVFEITANKNVDLVHDTYNGKEPWHKLLGLLAVYMYPYISNLLRKELWVYYDGIHEGLYYDGEFNGLLVRRFVIKLRQSNPERIRQFRDLILQYLREQLGVSEVVVHG
jgi:hypothetical protein